MIQVTRDNDILMLQRRIAALHHTNNVLTCRLRVIGGIHTDMRPFAHREGGRFLRLINLLHRLRIGLSCASEEVVYHRISHVAIDKSLVVGGVRTRHPLIEQAYGSMLESVIELGLMQRVVIPLRYILRLPATVGGLALHQNDLALHVNPFIVVIAQLRRRHAKTTIDHIRLHVAIARHASGKPAIRPVIPFADPDLLPLLRARRRDQDIHRATRLNLYAGMRKFLDVTTLVARRLQSPGLVIALHDLHRLRHTGRAGQASLQSGIGKLFHIAKKFLGGDRAVHCVQQLLLFGQFLLHAGLCLRCGHRQGEDGRQCA